VHWEKVSLYYRVPFDVVILPISGANRVTHSLAMAEMKLLLREVYSKCRTTISKDMSGDMTLADQIISSRPKGQTCLLAFESI